MKYWKFNRKYGVEKKVKIIIWHDIFSSLTLECAKQILVWNCFKGQVMKPNIVLHKINDNDFLTTYKIVLLKINDNDFLITYKSVI
jgi:hypothetical protein